MAAVLGKTEDAAKYAQIYENYCEAWQKTYVNQDGITICDTQTSYALGLGFHLLDAELADAAAERLNTLAQYSGYHIKTGFSGIGCLLPALSDYGFTETAYAFLLQEEYPSLLYPVTHGATTIPEQLSAYTEKEDGSCHLDGSLNHYTFGTPASWLYTNVLGIKSDENDPGFHHIILEPEIGGSLTYARGSYDSVYGTICVAWECSESGTEVTVSLPPNTTADLTLPDSSEGQKVYTLVSGTYSFTVQ
jgi:alpha-L-rhamnosidase